ncbi:dUTPase-like protein, partial [Thamnocephalis sphaerospora]
PLEVLLLTPDARPPCRSSDGAAGYDLFALHDVCIPARSQALVPTGVAVALPPGTYGRIAPRSGLALRKQLDTMAGVIDSDYRGELGGIVRNHGDQTAQLNKGDRFAQLILECCQIPPVQVVTSLDSTQRAAAGFGSTGLAEL